MCAAILDRDAEPWFFHRDNHGRSITDAYPEVVFSGFHHPKRSYGIARIMCYGSRASDALVRMTPKIISGVSEKINAPCPFEWKDRYPTVSGVDDLHQYIVRRPVVTQAQKAAYRAIMDGDEAKATEVAMRSVTRSIHRFCDTFGMQKPAGLDCYVEFPSGVEYVPVVNKGYHYIYLKSFKMAINMSLKGPFFIGGMATHGHGEVFTC